MKILIHYLKVTLDILWNWSLVFGQQQKQLALPEVEPRLLLAARLQQVAQAAVKLGGQISVMQGSYSFHYSSEKATVRKIKETFVKIDCGWNVW